MSKIRGFYLVTIAINFHNPLPAPVAPRILAFQDSISTCQPIKYVPAPQARKPHPRHQRRHRNSHLSSVLAPPCRNIVEDQNEEDATIVLYSWIQGMILLFSIADDSGC